MPKHITFIIEPRKPGGDVGDLWALNSGKTEDPKNNLEERLLEFASSIIDLSDKLPATRAGNHVAAQILRSGTSPYPAQGDIESAESGEEFIDRLKVCLKEFRETRRWARLILSKRWAQGDSTLLFTLGECDELIRIFDFSIQAAQKNAAAKKRRTRTSTASRVGKTG
jgi:four helix bundle protein